MTPCLSPSTHHSIIVRSTTVRAISRDIICQTIVQHCRTFRIKLRLSLSTFESRLKTHLFFLPLSANYSTYLFRQRLCSRVTALWRYKNFVLLLLLLLLLHVFHAACRIPVVFAHWKTGANSFLCVTLTSEMTYIVSGGALNSTHSLTVFDGKFATYRTNF